MFMFKFNKCDNQLCLSFDLPKFFQKKNNYTFRQYEIIYIRPNGCIITQLRENLPRVVEFREFEDHKYTDYIGCYNGLGWKIKNIRIVESKYVSK